MKLRKFTGETSRSVLEQVRAALGPDAVIVANRSTADGIEITAMPGEAFAGMLGAGPVATANRMERPVPVNEPPRGDEDVRVTLKNHVLRNEARAHAGPAVVPRLAEGAAQRSQQPKVPLPVLMNAMAAQGGDPGIGQRLAEEVAAMRAMLTEQIEQQAMTDAERRSPLRARSMRELLQAGYSSALARSLVQHMPDDFGAAQARAWMVELLARNLRCVAPEDDLVTRGGIYALVGPTGVGKTTTTAKLAARCAVRYGASRLALFTTDSYRVGAHDQLRIYARILGVNVQTIGDRADLRQALDGARGKHLVLIDTVGMGQRDARLPEQAALLAEPEVRRVLLLNSATQAETLDEVVCRYGTTVETALPLLGAILTKLDEAARLGPALDVAIRHRLSLQCVTNGQRVPEDLGPARGDYLVGRSLRAASRPTPFSFGADELALQARTNRESENA